MKSRILPLLAACAAAGFANGAHAAVTCNISQIDNFAALYDALGSTDYTSTGTFTVTCTRTAAGDPTSINFVTNTNNGLNPTGSNNRANLSGNFLRYDLFTSATYATNWTTQSNKSITGTVTLGTGVPSSASTTKTYYSKIAAGQSPAQGTYSDTITVTMTYGATSVSATPATIGVQITNVPGCEFATPPGNIAFTYTAFATAAATGSTPFGARCTTSLPYTMALDATSGVVSGLRYTLGLSAAGGTGNGAAQSYTVNGTMDAGQAGTCATSTCTGTNAHSITISY